MMQAVWSSAPGVDGVRLVRQSSSGLIRPPPAPFWDGERIVFSALAIGERVGKAGTDLLRSPMKRRSHARFSRCKDHGARTARCAKGEDHRNYPQRVP